MNGLTTLTGLEKATLAELETLEQVRMFMDSCPQIPMPTEHLLHGGMYARTIRMAPGDVVLGSVIKRATILILHGDVSVLGTNKTREYVGYNVIHASAGRQSLFVAHSWAELTMIVPTSATRVDQAEEEVFAQCDLLMSRQQGENTVTVTGE